MNTLSRAVEMEENFDEIFNLNPFLAELLFNDSPKSQTSENNGSGNADFAELLESSLSFISGSHGEETLSTEFSPSSASALTPQFVSVGNSKISSVPSKCNPDLEVAKDYSLIPQVLTLSSPAANDNSSNKQCQKKLVSSATRDPAIVQEHVLAERKRREHLSQLFITLSKVVPGLKKLDKISLLEDAISYLKALKEQVVILEKEEVSKKKSSSDAKSDDNERSSMTDLGAPEISVRIANKHVLVKICSQKEMGLLSSRIPIEMEKMNMSVTDMRIMPFGGSALDVTVLAEMQSEFGSTVKEIVDHLHAIL